MSDKRPHPFDPTLVMPEASWPDPIPCPPLDDEAVVEPDPILHPHLTPSIFETENGTP